MPKVKLAASQQDGHEGVGQPTHSNAEMLCQCRASGFGSRARRRFSRRPTRLAVRLATRRSTSRWVCATLRTTLTLDAQVCQPDPSWARVDEFHDIRVAAPRARSRDGAAHRHVASRSRDRAVSPPTDSGYDSCHPPSRRVFLVRFCVRRRSRCRVSPHHRSACGCLDYPRPRPRACPSARGSCRDRGP